MLYIEKGEDSRLPKKFIKVNNLCAILYDQLTEIFADENYRSLNGTKLDLDKTKHVLVEELQKGKVHILDWLAENEMRDELTSFLAKHITMSILSDFVNFVYESLSCAKKGKMSVAYALLRKPFTDELLILEQLLHDPQDFIQRFYYSGDPTDYDPSHHSISKKEIISNAMKAVSPKSFLHEDIVYELRYDKTSPAGINGKSNHALHIVTRDKRYQTPNQDLNFIFFGKDDIETHWEHYYSFVPYLLMYSAAIVDSILFSYLPDKEDLKYIKSLQRLIGYAMLSDAMLPKMRKGNKMLYQALTKSIVIECSSCKKTPRLSKADFELFFQTRMLVCPRCYENVLTDSESIEPIKNFMRYFN